MSDPEQPQPVEPPVPTVPPPATSGWVTADEPPPLPPPVLADEPPPLEPVVADVVEPVVADIVEDEDDSPVELAAEWATADLGVPPARLSTSSAVLTAMATLAVLAVLAVALLGALTLLRPTPAEQRDEARDQALRTARDAARLLLAYDYRRLDQDFAAGLALTADPFKSEYSRTTSKLVTDVAKKYQAVVRSEVVQAGAVEVTADRVVALVFVNQTTTSTRVQGAKVDLSRVRMVLERRGGAWKVVDVDAL